MALHLYFNGTLTYDRPWDTRARAVEEASLKRQDLEREGWIPHW